MTPLAPARHSLRILCAEDDEDLLACTAELLHLHEHRVDCAADGREALEKLLQDSAAFDLLITDREMPRLDGVGLGGGTTALWLPRKGDRLRHRVV
jgi:CheY-like chemotaxis protein